MLPQPDPIHRSEQLGVDAPVLASTQGEGQWGFSPGRSLR